MTHGVKELTNAELEDLQDGKHYFTNGNQIFLSQDNHRDLIKQTQSTLKGEADQVATLLYQSMTSWLGATSNGQVTLTGSNTYWREVFDLFCAATNMPAPTLSSDQSGNTLVNSQDAHALAVWSVVNRQVAGAPPVDFASVTPIQLQYDFPSLRPLYTAFTTASSYLPGTGSVTRNSMFNYLTKGTATAPMDPLRLDRINLVAADALGSSFDFMYPLSRDEFLKPTYATILGKVGSWSHQPLTLAELNLANDYKNAAVAGRALYSLLSVPDEVYQFRNGDWLSGLGVFFSASQLLTAGWESAYANKNYHVFGDTGRIANILLFNLPGFASNYYKLFDDKATALNPSIGPFAHAFAPISSLLKAQAQSASALPRLIDYFAALCSRSPQTKGWNALVLASIQEEMKLKWDSIASAFTVADGPPAHPGPGIPDAEMGGYDLARQRFDAFAAQRAKDRMAFFLSGAKVTSWQLANGFGLTLQYRALMGLDAQLARVTRDKAEAAALLRNSPSADLQRRLDMLTVQESNLQVYSRSALVKLVGLAGVAADDFLGMDFVQLLINKLFGPRGILLTREFKAFVAPTSWSAVTAANLDVVWNVDPTLRPEQVWDEKMGILWSLASTNVFMPFISAGSRALGGFLRPNDALGRWVRAKRVDALTGAIALGSQFLMQWMPVLTSSRLTRLYTPGSLDPTLAGRRLSQVASHGSFAAFQEKLRADSSITSNLAADVLRYANDAGYARNYYEVVGYQASGNGLEDYQGALAWHVQNGEITSAGIVAQEGDDLDRVHLGNLSGEHATYVVYPSASNIAVDVSSSIESSTNEFRRLGKSAVIFGGASREIYHLQEALDTQPDTSNPTKAASGYIVDGFGANLGMDLVAFDEAVTGQTIHVGTQYKGLVSYQGIFNFVGSSFDDEFTRYGSQAADSASMYLDGGAGKDKFDLRSGNNFVTLHGGVVKLNSEDTPIGD